MSPLTRIAVTEAEAGLRLDQCLAEHLSEHSRSQVQRFIDQQLVLVNGQTVTRRSSSVHAGDLLEIQVPAEAPAQLLPESFDLPILHEDDDLLVIHKPAGMIVHPGAGTGTSETLVNALLGYDCEQFSQMLDEEQRPGIVHRLDKDTSGVLVVGRNARATSRLSQQFADREVRKIYLALVTGVPSPPAGVIDAPIGRHPIHRHKMAVRREGGRQAVTYYATLGNGDGVALVQARIETGRTHQIRVHLTHRGYPILGDPVYGRQGDEAPRQMLHAWQLSLSHPTTGAWMTFLAPPPDDMIAACAEHHLIVPDHPLTEPADG